MMNLTTRSVFRSFINKLLTYLLSKKSSKSNVNPIPGSMMYPKSSVRNDERDRHKKWWSREDLRRTETDTS